MDRFSKIKNKLLALAETDERIQCVVMIGSSVRETAKADAYSDLDLVIVTQAPALWLYGDRPAMLGDIRISFVEPTLGGGMERRILYDGSLDVDLIVFSPEQFTYAITSGAASEVMDRGYRILHDRGGYRAMLAEHISPEIPAEQMCEDEFQNLVNDFFFHTVWAEKKLRRGEFWSAKMCIDGYLKQLLQRMIAQYSATKYACDTWHSGRFLDTWAEPAITQALPTCFAHYEREDMHASLLQTHALFRSLAKESASLLGYPYPQEAESYSFQLLLEQE